MLRIMVHGVGMQRWKTHWWMMKYGLVTRGEMLHRKWEVIAWPMTLACLSDHMFIRPRLYLVNHILSSQPCSYLFDHTLFIWMLLFWPHSIHSGGYLICGLHVYHVQWHVVGCLGGLDLRTYALVFCLDFVMFTWNNFYVWQDFAWWNLWSINPLAWITWYAWNTWSYQVVQAWDVFQLRNILGIKLMNHPFCWSINSFHDFHSVSSSLCRRPLVPLLKLHIKFSFWWAIWTWNDSWT